MTLGQEIDSEAGDWPRRLRDLMHRLDWSGDKAAQELGVTSTWVSRLRRGKGVFSPAIKRQIANLEHLHLGQSIEPETRQTDESTALPYVESSAALEAIARQKFEAIIRSAAGKPERVGWIIVQLDAHLSAPGNWQPAQSEPMQNASVRAALEEGRRRGFAKVGAILQEQAAEKKKEEQLG